MPKADFKDYVCRPYCSFYKESQKEEMACRGAEVIITARSDGFLYKMVRSLAGFLIRVGEGEVPPAQAATILDSRTRTARVPTAPPQGLFLWQD